MYYISVIAFGTLRLRQRKSYVLIIRLLLIYINIGRCGGTGRRTGLKILRDLYSHTGSIPVAGILIKSYT